MRIHVRSKLSRYVLIYLLKAGYQACPHPSELWPYQDSVDYRVEVPLFCLCGLGVYVPLFSLAPLQWLHRILTLTSSAMLLKSGEQSMLPVCIIGVGRIDTEHRVHRHEL